MAYFNRASHHKIKHTRPLPHSKLRKSGGVTTEGIRRKRRKCERNQTRTVAYCMQKSSVVLLIIIYTLHAKCNRNRVSHPINTPPRKRMCKTWPIKVNDLFCFLAMGKLRWIRLCFFFYRKGGFMGRNTCASSSRRELETFIIISIIITIIFYTTFTHTHTH